MSGLIENTVIALGWMLVHFVWQAAAVGAIVAALTLIVKQRYWLYAGSMLLLACVALSTFAYQYGWSRNSQTENQPVVAAADRTDHVNDAHDNVLTQPNLSFRVGAEQSLNGSYWVKVGGKSSRINLGTQRLRHDINIEGVTVHGSTHPGATIRATPDFKTDYGSMDFNAENDGSFSVLLKPGPHRFSVWHMGEHGYRGNFVSDAIEVEDGGSNIKLFRGINK